MLDDELLDVPREEEEYEDPDITPPEPKEKLGIPKPTPPKDDEDCADDDY